MGQHDIPSSPAAHGPPQPPSGGFGHSSNRVAGELVLVVVLFAAVGWLAMVGIRWLAVAAVMALPLEADVQVGRLAAQATLAGKTQCNNPVLLEAVEALAAPMRTRLPEEMRGFKVHVVDDQTVNAYALPGGELFLLTGFLEQAESSSEVVGVMGHEIGHAVLRHGMRAMTHQLGLVLALTILTGGMDSVTQGLAAQAASMEGLAFSREQESQADVFGVRLATDAGWDPSRVVDFFTRMQQDNAMDVVPAWLTTHPANQDRVHNLQGLLHEHPPLGTDPMPAVEPLHAPCMVEPEAEPAPTDD